MESEVVFKFYFLSDSEYSRAPNGPFKEGPIEDSSQSARMMQEEGMKDNTRLEMQRFRRDNGLRSNLSIPGSSWQTEKAEIQHIDIWMRQCSAKAEAHTA